MFPDKKIGDFASRYLDAQLAKYVLTAWQADKLDDFSK